jgi:hypothetical protein
MEQSQDVCVKMEKLNTQLHAHSDHHVIKLNQKIQLIFMFGRENSFVLNIMKSGKNWKELNVLMDLKNVELFVFQQQKIVH